MRTWHDRFMAGEIEPEDITLESICLEFEAYHQLDPSDRRRPHEWLGLTRVEYLLSSESIPAFREHMRWKREAARWEAHGDEALSCNG